MQDKTWLPRDPRAALIHAEPRTVNKIFRKLRTHPNIFVVHLCVFIVLLLYIAMVQKSCELVAHKSQLLTQAERDRLRRSYGDSERLPGEPWGLGIDGKPGVIWLWFYLFIYLFDYLLFVCLLFCFVLSCFAFLCFALLFFAFLCFLLCFLLC